MGSLTSMSDGHVERRTHRTEANRSPRRLLDRSAWHGLAIAYLTFTLIGVAVGELIVHPLKPTAVGRFDGRVSEWAAEHRSPGWTTVSSVGSQLTDTYVKVGATVLAMAVAAVIFRRWLEPMLIGIPLVLEASAFITTTAIVGRPRPPVQHLGDSGVGTSFPSGHMAAAVVYSAIGVVVFLHRRGAALRVITAMVLAAIVLLVGFARVYRGMHYLTDVLAGALLGAAAVVVSTRVLLAAQHRADRADAEQTRREPLVADP